MKKITFAIPDGYAVPEGTASGDTFDASVTLKLEDDGKRLCLTAVDGVAMPGYEEESEKGRKAQEGLADADMGANLAQRYATAMQQPPAQ